MPQGTQGVTFRGAVGVLWAPAPGAQVYVAQQAAAHLLLAPGRRVFAVGAAHARLLRGTAGEEGRYEVHGLLLDAAYAVVAIQRDQARSPQHDDVDASIPKTTRRVATRRSIKTPAF